MSKKRKKRDGKEARLDIKLEAERKARYQRAADKLEEGELSRWVRKALDAACDAAGIE